MARAGRHEPVEHPDEAVIDRVRVVEPGAPVAPRGPG